MMECDAKLLQKAIDWASFAHEGQRDKVGMPYILHPLAVMLSLPAYDVMGRIVAVLHDVIEDTGLTLEHLSKWLPPHLVEAIDAMSKRKGEELETYWARVKANPIALRVKRADIAHNTSPERLDMLDERTRERLKKKYGKALAFLNS